MHLLVVDDGQGESSSITRALSDLDVRVAEARSLEEALEHMPPQDRSMILLDAQALSALHARAAQGDRHAARAHELESLLATERRSALETEARTTDERCRLARRLAASDRQRDELLATLAHELRNPLAPVVAGLELLRIHGAADPDMDRARAAMERQIYHLVRLVDDLLDASRISRGKVSLHREWIDLRDVVRHAVEPWRGELRKRRHELALHVPAAPVPCHGDRVRLTQLVDNLISNAVRHTGTDTRIRLVLTLDEGEAVLQVEDDGPGISPDVMDRIFDMFVQERRGNGLGLGLTLVQKIANLHGGSVAATKPGTGTAFEVRLPLARMPAQEIGSLPEVSPAERPLRIMVVEDERDVRETTQALLQAWGHEVEVAATGLDAVDMVLDLRPEIALLDIGLPDIDGYTAASRIVDIMGANRPRLVALSGYGQDSDRRRGREAGFDAHLVKPVAPETLRRTLFDVLDTDG